MDDQLYYYAATITKIVDADTVYADVDLGFSITKKEKLRLARIDAPEVRGAEREAGLEAKSWLQSRLAIGDRVLIRTSKSDSFGRYIAEIFIENGEELLNINDELVKVGHAEYKEY
tara:strand:- start:284 stop:631 length:348 start_codon:yes stop_codon:yes gene_type:complete